MYTNTQPPGWPFSDTGSIVIAGGSVRLIATDTAVFNSPRYVSAVWTGANGLEYKVLDVAPWKTTP